MHPGGIADKVGNRYEALWLIRHLIELIDGRARSVSIELLGEEGAGFEFCVERSGHELRKRCLDVIDCLIAKDLGRDKLNEATFTSMFESC